MTEKKIAIEVAYAQPHKQKIIALEVEGGTTAVEAIKQSDICRYFPEIDPDTAVVGKFGQKLQNPSEYQVIIGDRIEIYRPLIADPKEIRRLRAEKMRLKQQENNTKSKKG